MLVKFLAKFNIYPPMSLLKINLTGIVINSQIDIKTQSSLSYFRPVCHQKKSINYKS